MFELFFFILGILISLYSLLVANSSFCNKYYIKRIVFFILIRSRLNRPTSGNKEQTVNSQTMVASCSCFFL